MFGRGACVHWVQNPAHKVELRYNLSYTFRKSIVLYVLNSGPIDKWSMTKYVLL
jgi:hypothetical protein